MRSTALARIVVGVVVERRKAKSPWLDFLWRPVSVLVGTPSALPWTRIGEQGDVTTFYAGEAAIELHRTETANYRQNLSSGMPALWVVLRPTLANSASPAFDILTVTADPSEGEALTDAGNNLVATVPMPAAIIETSTALSPSITSSARSTNGNGTEVSRRCPSTAARTGKNSK